MSQPMTPDELIKKAMDDFMMSKIRGTELVKKIAKICEGSSIFETVFAIRLQDKYHRAVYGPQWKLAETSIDEMFEEIAASEPQ